MNEDQKQALSRLAEELREYVESMNAAVFVPNNANDLLNACDKVKAEFKL